MRREILMPPVTPSMIDGTISRWHVAEGQAVAAGDVLVEIATSTATLEIEAASEGHIERILVPAGTERVKVNTPIAIVAAAANKGTGPREAATQPLSFSGDPLRRDEPRTPARPQSGSAPREQSYREALRDGLAEEMRRDDSVFLIGVDVAQNRGANKVTQGLIDEFGPRRVVSVPPVKEALYGIALGAALAGLRPVVELSSWGRAFEAIGPYLAAAAETFYLSGGTQPVPIVFRGPNGFVPGLTGQDARCVAAQLAQIPGLKVAQPATAITAKTLLAAAIRDAGPVAVLEHELLYSVRGPAAEAESGGPVTMLGAARVALSGRDITIAAAGRAVTIALEAALELARDGIEAEVIDLMCVRPLDRDAVVASVVRTGRLVTVEEGVGDLGIGAELVASVTAHAFGNLKAPPMRIAGASVPMPYAAELQARAVPSADQIVEAVRRLVRATR